MGGERGEGTAGIRGREYQVCKRLTHGLEPALSDPRPLPRYIFPKKVQVLEEKTLLSRAPCGSEAVPVPDGCTEAGQVSPQRLVAFPTVPGRPLAPQPQPSASGSAHTQQARESQQRAVHLTGLGSRSQRPWLLSLPASGQARLYFW